MTWSMVNLGLELPVKFIPLHRQYMPHTHPPHLETQPPPMQPYQDHSPFAPLVHNLSSSTHQNPTLDWVPGASECSSDDMSLETSSTSQPNSASTSSESVLHLDPQGPTITIVSRLLPMPHNRTHNTIAMGSSFLSSSHCHKYSTHAVSK
ncbi:hypothetical protein PIB30_043041 [Stylosanthes scabra]|uniref:Uncharacterized protein n=1 Tax=Stylosanthes scabra TaxID=79078 RepID=A0ABU6ZE56_9FABA|nr:hypothetical protein [Stylosanthes scabra]